MHRAWLTNSASGDASTIPNAALPTAPILIGTVLENGDGGVSYTGNTGRLITPPEFNWSFWSGCIHGHRFAVVFSYTSTGHGPSQTGFSKTILSGTINGQTYPPQTISMFTQGQYTSNQVADIAPILNSPFARGFCTVSPSGYVFPVYQPNSQNGGIELCAKWYQGGSYTGSHGTGTSYLNGNGPNGFNGVSFGNGFYIFATTRNSETVTNQSATFTVADTGKTSVPVLGENRNVTLSAASGSPPVRTFTDTFASAWSVHIYGPF
jgi:hypothetical protein